VPGRGGGKRIGRLELLGVIQPKEVRRVQPGQHLAWIGAMRRRGLRQRRGLRRTASGGIDQRPGYTDNPFRPR
jgi:hypothetical protein